VATIDRNSYSRPLAASAASPFRYPGGKGFLTEFLRTRIERIQSEAITYVEPFAGGAGAAMNLFRDGVVKRVILNDLDVRIYSAWRALLEENQRFRDRLGEVAITIDNWFKYRSIVDAPPNEYSFETGFATFFINRTSRAGILQGSGPIGGYQQNGKWKIDARFYRATMLERVKWIGDNSAFIEISQQSAVKFLKSFQNDPRLNEKFFFIDPPYVDAGTRLYFNGMSELDHRELARFLLSDVLRHWVLTYDSHPLIEKLYSTRDHKYLEVGYSLARVRNEEEILISSN
jgi:DNA adenine methylase